METEAYITRGTQGLPAIIMLHGAGASGESMLPLMEMLAKDADMTALNLPGAGRYGGEAIDDIEQLAAYTAGFIAARGGRPWLLGHSLGSAAALQTARRWPGLVQGLILLSPALSMPLSSGFMDRVRGDVMVTMSAFMRRAYGPAAREEWIEASLALLARLAPQTVLNDFQACRGYDASPYLAALNLPCLIVSGEEDALNNCRQSQEMAQILPDCRLALIPGAGHMLPRQAPDAVAGHIRNFINDF
ncbi:MAG: alpha/beta hydrolase [Desulfarculales bacterium]|jgi:pimeloyl-ACP methyl ester carboxylesterase|nr:alpha/beta hydrolase [Desulfarculales bacterium]